ncbi:MAG: DUF3828 domain-containing protein [Flavisolibacter sp.]
MKRKLFAFTLLLILISVSSYCVQAQNAYANKSAEGMLKEFYTKYITEVFMGANEKKIHLILKKYCTVKLLNKVPKLTQNIDGDPFLKAQDSDTSNLKSLSIKKDNKRKNIYSVSYIANPNHQITIHLLVVKESGSFKIDSVW